MASDELGAPKPSLDHLRETLIVTPERTSELNARTESLWLIQHIIFGPREEI